MLVDIVYKIPKTCYMTIFFAENCDINKAFMLALKNKVKALGYIM